METKTYEFTLVLGGVNEKTPNLEDALYEAGCNDAIVCYGKKAISLDFMRKACTLKEAVNTAIEDINKSNLPVYVDHIGDIYVNITGIALKTEISKQRISYYTTGQRGPGDFPVAYGDETYSVYKWSEVANWLFKNGKIQDINVVEEARILEELDYQIQQSKQVGAKTREGIAIDQTEYYARHLGEPNNFIYRERLYNGDE